jgi:hypothetical protein
MKFDSDLQRLFVAARHEQAPSLDVVGRVLRALPTSNAVPLSSTLPSSALSEDDFAEWIGAGVSSLVAAGCLWMAASWWGQVWVTSWEAWHPMMALMQ